MIPKWLLEQEKITRRQWKARKRRELRALEKAFSTFRLGCAYTPAMNVNRIKEVLSEYRKAMSVKEWGR